jgi:hypothetical protein
MKNAKKYTINPNEIYGPYITIEEVIKEGKKSIETLWRAKHLITDKEIISRAAYLVQIKKKYDDKLKSNEYQSGLKNYLFNNTKRGARVRGHEFNLTVEDFRNIIIKDCHYCGEKPQRSTNKAMITRGHINEPPFYYNGIDRIDSKIGYHPHNCVPCCNVCNYMKNTLTNDIFLEKIEKIYNYLIKN